MGNEDSRQIRLTGNLAM